MIHRSPCETVALPDVSLPRFVLDVLRDQGERVAIVDGPSGRMLSAAQVVAQTERFAASLAARGFRKGDVLAILSPNVPEYARISSSRPAPGSCSRSDRCSRRRSPRRPGPRWRRSSCWGKGKARRPTPP
jgi:hypothetical protein